MSRVVSTTLVLGGATLLATWLVSPASSSSVASAPVPTASGQVGPAPELVAVDREVQRMRERLRPSPDFPTPRRDPFTFGARHEPANPDPVPADAALIPRVVPALPTLVAILSETVDGVPVHTAVLSGGDDVRMVKVGANIGVFRVTSVGAASVELVHEVSGQSFTLSLH